MKLELLHNGAIRANSLSENSEQGYDRSQSTPEAIRRRSERNKARRKLEKSGKVHKGDDKHVHHKKPLSKGGSNTGKNLAVVDAETNWREGNSISSKNRKRKKD